MSSGMIPATAPEPVARSAWQKWVGFWFPAADPTTLGFIRLTTGLLVLYIHLAYSVNLQQFFGKTGWYGHRYIERERTEYPWRVTPFWEWDPQSAVSAKLPEFPHRREAVVKFMKNLPDDEKTRKDSLRFLERLAKYENPDQPRQVMAWFSMMGMSEGERDHFLAVLVNPPGQELLPNNPDYFYANNTPALIGTLSEPERKEIADEVKTFWEILPKTPKERQYVLQHITEVPQEIRKSFTEFLVALPQDKAAREKKIEYLEYWNEEPDKAIRIGHPIFSVWFHVTDPTWMTIIHIGILCVMVMFTLGLFTRVTSVLTWIAVVGYIHRTQQVLFGMDTMMNILLFYLMVGNSGAALSLDRLIARYRAVRASLRRSGTIDPATRAFLAAPPPSRSAGFGTRLIQVHFCFIYLAAGLSKLKGAAWWGGNATWDVFVNPEFTMMQYEWYEKALRGLVNIKPLYYAMIIGGSWFTLFIEIAGPFLLWTRLRWLIMFLATLMHALIAVMMGLNLFELLMIVMVLAFVPDGVIRDRFRGAADLLKHTFAFNPASAVSARAASLVAAADVESQVAFVSDSTLPTPTVTDSEGKKQTGLDGVAALFRSVRLLASLGFALWLPGVKGLFARLFFPTPPANPPSSPGGPPSAPKPPAPAAAS